MTFADVLAKMQSIHDRKSQDYGSNEDKLANYRRGERLGIPTWKNIYGRLLEKSVRIESFCQNGKLNFEGVEDTLLDMANLCVLCLMAYHEQEKAKTSGENKDSGNNS